MLAQVLARLINYDHVSFSSGHLYHAKVQGIVDYIKIVNDRCILGVVHSKSNEYPVTLYNFISNQPVVLPTDRLEAIAGDGSRICYEGESGLIVQMLDCEGLSYSELSLSLDYHQQRSQVATYQAVTYPIHNATNTFPSEEESILALQNTLNNSARQGAYTIAFLPNTDIQTLSHISFQLERIALVKTIKLPERGPRISVRTLLGYIDDIVNSKSLLTDNELVAVINRYQTIIIDRAERMQGDTLRWFVSRSSEIAAAILLVARRQGTFEQIALDVGVLIKGMQIDLHEFATDHPSKF